MTEQYSRSKIPLKPLYTPEDIKELDYEKHLNAPGSFPFTRGQRAGAGRGWIHRELSGEGDPVRSNEQLKYLIAQGQMGIDVIGDSPTMAWLDPDHPMAGNAIGTQGVSLCCLNDYRELYRDLPLESLSVSASLPPILAVAGLYLVARERGIPAATLRGSVLQWPFYAEDCGYAVHMPFPLRLRLALDCIEFCTKEMPKFHAFLEDTYFFSEAGLNPVEEVALGLIEIRYIVRKLLERGVDIDSFAPRIAILVNCSMDFFDEIAKIRATRRLFARMMREEYGAKDPRSMAVVITCHTSGLSLTAQQPFNNIVRGAIQSMALVLAGVHAIEISAFDEAYRTPSPESHMVGLRTQQVIHSESGVTRVMDPLGGSYYVESLTDDMEKRIWDMVLDIESRGDPAELVDRGWFKRFFEEVMARYAGQVAEGELLKVGFNCHQIPDEEDTLLKEVAETKFEPCWDRSDKIKEYKQSRDRGRIKEMLQEINHKAKIEGENLTNPIILGFEAGATMGEIAGALRLAYDWPYDPLGKTESLI
jgi:methylmalonyl-CoA mutase N-terminal domain/subunit